MPKSIVSFQPTCAHGKISYQISTKSFTCRTKIKRSLTRLARQCEIKRICKRVKSKKFLDQHHDPLTADYFFIQFLHEIVSRPQCFQLLKEIGYQPATLRETLSFLIKFPQFRRKKFLALYHILGIGQLKESAPSISIPMSYINQKLELHAPLGGAIWQNDLVLIRKVALPAEGDLTQRIAAPLRIAPDTISA